LIYAGIPARERKKIALQALEDVGLGERVSHRPNEISGGQKQRVAIARSLINDPAVILADEPSGNLDSKNSLELYRIFKELRKDFDQTFIIVTHNEEHARLTDRMLTIKDGIISG